MPVRVQLPFAAPPFLLSNFSNVSLRDPDFLREVRGLAGGWYGNGDGSKMATPEARIW